MGDRHPQPTAVLVRRLQRIARALDAMVKNSGGDRMVIDFATVTVQAYVNTLYQAAGRLEDLDV